MMLWWALRRLRSPDRDVRKRAAEKLARSSNRAAAAALVPLLQDPDSSVRRAAAAALEALSFEPADDVARAWFAVARGRIRETDELGTAAVPALVDALGDPDENVRITAASLLGGIGDTGAVEPLIAALEREAHGKWTRGTAAEALARLQDGRALPALARALGDSQVRDNAARALESFGARATDAVIVALGDKNARWMAVKVLAKVGDERAVEPLVRALRDESISVREEAARTLQAIGDPRAAAPLIAALEDSEAAVASAAALALAASGSPEAERALARALGSDRAPTRHAAASGLAAMEEAGSPHLVSALRHADWRVRSIAGDTLAARSFAPPSLDDAVWLAIARATEDEAATLGAEAVEPLVQALSHSDWRASATAVRALGKIGDTRAIGPLLDAALRTHDTSYRHRIAEALGEIGGPDAVGPLCRMATDGRVADSALPVLERILAKHAAAVDGETLAAVGSLSSTVQDIYELDGQLVSHPKVKPVDSSAVRALAQGELARRGKQTRDR